MLNVVHGLKQIQQRGDNFYIQVARATEITLVLFD